MNVGDKVQVIKINPFGRGYLKKYYRRIGVITEVALVHPSRRVKDGKVYKVSFPRLNPQKFITQELRLVDEIRNPGRVQEEHS